MEEAFELCVSDLPSFPLYQVQPDLPKYLLV